MAFQSQIPHYRPSGVGNSIADLLVRQGDIGANQAMQSAAIWGRTLENLGQIGGQTAQAVMQQKQEEKDQKKREQIIESGLASWDGKDPMSLYRAWVPALGSEAAMKATAGMVAIAKAQQGIKPDPKQVVSGLAAFEQKTPGWIVKNWATTGPVLAPVAEMWGLPLNPKEPPADFGEQILALDAKLNGKEQEGALVDTVDAQGRPVKRRATPQELAVGVPLAPKEATPPSPGSFDAFVASRYPQGATPEQMLQARGEWGRADDRPRDPLAAELAQLRLDEARQRAQEAAASAEALKGMGAEWEGLVGRATSSMSGPKSAGWRKTLAQTALTGDKEELADQIRQAALESENVAQKDQIVGRRATIASLEDTRSILRELKAKGVPTNWLAGNVEDLARKLGTSTNTEYVALGNRLMGTLINYRRAATGVQFSEKEQAQYSKMFPNYTNTLPVNLALIDGLMREMKTYDRVYWEGKLGKKGARLVGVVKDEEPSAEATGTPPRPPNVPANYRWDPSVRRWRP